MRVVANYCAYISGWRSHNFAVHDAQMDARPPQPPEGRLLEQRITVELGLSYREAAKQVGISDARLRQFANGFTSVGGGQYVTVTAPAKRLAAIALKFDITPDQLDDAGRGDAAAILRSLRTDVVAPAGIASTSEVGTPTVVDPLEIDDDAEAMQEFLRQRAYRKGQRDVGGDA